ncbi:Panacea domain-containing protein [Steroidobacter sp.]|uniref:Panacea domain-containing protein n=1 Tax=Steroidobacter sp. TaxID=1978227 RepID=UPI001A3CCBD6|nr:type II toxin-antitoxin system antitoxin SocA domain-containing protein [Steroidobacter sp.]MBL8269253.1 DUF4065 domain-containing protein [Steroidobacter sp.]
MPYSTETVVNSILQRGFREKRADLTPMKMQKLLYFLNGWHLAVSGKPVVDQPFEAWKYGPVVESAYKQMRRFGADCVSDYLKVLDPKSGEWKAYVVSDDDKTFADVLDLTWEKYIGIDALHLSAMTHEKGSPWHETHRNAGQGSVIPNELIRKYFVGLAKAA